MAKLNQDKEKLEIFISIIILVSWVMLWVGFALFTEGALFEKEDPNNPFSVQYFEKTSFYWWIFGGGIFIIMSVGISKIIVNNNKKLMDKFGWVTKEFIHDPEEAPIGRIKPIANFLSSPINTIFIALIIFSIFSVFGVINQSFFFAQPPIEQQATPTAQLILATEPASTSETIAVIALLMVFDGIIFLIMRKLGASFDNYLVVSTIMDALFGMLLWLGLHLLRYGGSDLAITSVLFFGFFGALITKVFGTIIFWLVWHITNNFFFQATKLFDSDTILSLTIVGIIILITLFTAVLLSKSKRASSVSIS